MYPFKYQKAATVRGAVSLLNKAEDPKLLAGGHTLIPTMKQRLASPKTLIDLSGAGLSGIEQKGRNIVIGAMTTHAEVANSPVVQQAIPALAALAGHIGDPHVRHRGTIGGSVANNDPAACYPSAVLALGASIVTDRRTIAADDFFTGMFSTALAEDEIITAIRFPIPGRAAYV
jgi:carbon-monoxide dehydrogenase medium subunit